MKKTTTEGLAESFKSLDKFYNQVTLRWIEADSFYKGKQSKPKWHETVLWKIQSKISTWRLRLAELIAGQSFDNYD